MKTFCRTMLPVLLLTLPAVVRAQFKFTTNNGSITITAYTGSGGAVSIPDMTNGLQVTSIGMGAFGKCSGLTSIAIPSSVKWIGDTAFSSCSNLTKVIIPNSVISIGNQAFKDCANLGDVIIPNGVTNIGYGAFFGCFSITNVTIGSSVTTIGHAAFARCTNLTVVLFEGNPPSPGYNVFSFDSKANVYHWPGTTGWDIPFCGLTPLMWKLPAASNFNGNVNLRGYGIPGQSYDIQRSTDLVTWTTISGSIGVTAATNALILYTDNPGSVTTFYRFAAHP